MVPSPSIGSGKFQLDAEGLELDGHRLLSKLTG
jgi:hypothetical protein